MAYKVFTASHESKTFAYSVLLAVVLCFITIFLCLKGPSLTKKLSLRSFEEKENLYPSLEGEVFSLEPTKFVFSYPDIRSDIDVYVHKNRPDLPKTGKDLSIFLKKSQEKKSISLGERVFLSYDFAKNLHFTEEKDLFWIRPIRIEQDSIQMEVKIDSQGFKVEKPQFDHTSFILPSKSPVLSEITDTTNFHDFAKARWWGTDQFQLIYSSKPEKHRIELTDRIIEVSEGEYYTYKEGVWEKTELGEASVGYPLAYIKSISNKIMEIEGWDEAGNQYYYFPIPLHPSQPVHHQMEDLISNIRMRTLKQVSFFLDKERMIMKVGDWAAKLSGNWKVLKTKEDFAEYFAYRETSDLFIFDGVERKSHQKTLTGHIFNPMRTEAKEVRIPIDYTRSLQKSHSSSVQKSTSTSNKRIKKSISKLSKTSKRKK